MAKQKVATMDDLITAREAAAVLGVTKRHVLRLIAKGAIRGKQFASNFWLVDRASLTSWKPERIRKHVE